MHQKFCEYCINWELMGDCTTWGVCSRDNTYAKAYNDFCSSWQSKEKVLSDEIYKTIWKKMRTWLIAGTFYHGNETPKWVVLKILDKMDQLETIDPEIEVINQKFSESKKPSQCSTFEQLVEKVEGLESKVERLQNFYDVNNVRFEDIRKDINEVDDDIRHLASENRKINVRLDKVFTDFKTPSELCGC